MTSDVDFYFQPGKTEIYRELLEFSAAEGTGKGGELVSTGHRIFARAAGRCEKEKRKTRSAILDSKKSFSISDIATRA